MNSKDMAPQTAPNTRMPFKLLESPEAGALAVGIFVGLVAIAFTESVHLIRHHFTETIALGGGLQSSAGRIIFIASIAGGCTLAAAMGVWLLGDAARGGINVAIARYHDGKVPRSRTLWYKLAQSALALGSGSAGGGEGPIGYMGGVAGATVVRFMRLSPQSRRALLAAGMGAGIASLFKAPMAGAIFAAEVLYSSMGIEARVLFVSVPASAAAFCVYGVFYGFDPALPITTQAFTHPSELIGYAILGIACAGVGRVFHSVIHWVESLSGSGIRRVIAAFTGSLAVGSSVALFVEYGLSPDRGMALLGDGYGLFQFTALEPEISAPLITLSLVILARIAFSAIGIGTGTGIGDFAPAVTLGGLTGVFVSYGVSAIYPPLAPPPAAAAVVGMAAFYGGLSRAPIAGVLLVSEITGRYTLMIPALWTSVIAFRMLGKTSFYQAQKERPDPAEDLWRKPTGEDLPVGDIIPVATRTEIPFLRPEEPATRLILLDFPVAAITREDGGVTAFLFANDIEHHRSRNEDVHLMTAGELARTDLTPVAEDEALSIALAQMLRDGVNALPVRLREGRYAALTRDDILRHLRIAPETAA